MLTYTKILAKSAEKRKPNHAKSAKIFTMDQDLALEIMLAGHNAFLTGAAGAGKTFTLNEFIKIAKKQGRKVAVTATTGLAATHLGGNTIHAWSGLGVLDSLPRNFFDKMSKGRREQIAKADVLIIDEISMLHDFRLDLVEEICRTVCENDAPFGGLQIIFSGDFFQLPPVTPREKRAQKTASFDGVDEIFDEDDAPKTEFAYNAASWAAANPVILYLNSQHRQTDDEFLDILNKIRKNKITRADAEKIAKRYRADLNCGGEITELHTTNRDVDFINDRKMTALPGEFHDFAMTATGRESAVERLKKSCLAPETLRLKKGCLVMALKNDPEQGFANGSTGTVIDFAKDAPHLPIVEFRDGRKITIQPATWELRDGDKKLASLAQIPLRPAYAITVHKSQGMTLDAAKINLANVFEPGMGYVALSRVRSLDALSILGLSSAAFFVHPEVLAKDQEFQKLSAAAEIEFANLRKNKAKREARDAVKSAKSGAGKSPADASDKARAWAEKLAKMREVHPNAYRPWSKTDDAKLEKLFRGGASVQDLTAAFGRHPGAIRARLVKLFGEDVEMR